MKTRGIVATSHDGIVATSHDGIVTLSGLHFLPFGVRTAPNHPYPHSAKHMMHIC